MRELTKAIAILCLFFTSISFLYFISAGLAFRFNFPDPIFYLLPCLYGFVFLGLSVLFFELSNIYKDLD